MNRLFTMARKGVMLSAASAVLALAVPTLAVAGHHGHHGHHHHHGHGHHHHHHWHHRHWRHVHFYNGGGRCVYWRNECGDRWGWGSPLYGRCLWRHGC
jgi:hypothetical protein